MIVRGIIKQLPEFIHNIYKVQGGKVLTDITFITHDGCHCSLTSCGVELNITREAIELQTLKCYDECVLPDASGNSFWYGPEANWSKEDLVQIKRHQWMSEVIRSGGHICDERGFLLGQFKTA